MLTVILTGLGSRLTRPINSHFDRFGVSGDLRRRRRHCYRQGEALACNRKYATIIYVLCEQSTLFNIFRHWTRGILISMRRDAQNRNPEELTSENDAHDVKYVAGAFLVDFRLATRRFVDAPIQPASKVRKRG